MKKAILIIAALGVFMVSCDKESVTSNSIDKPEGNLTAMSASGYDYTQPLEDIIDDAAATASGPVQNALSNKTTITVVSGTFVGENDSTGSVMCAPGSVCEIIVTTTRIMESNSNGTIIYTADKGGDLVAIVAYPTGPSASLVSSVTVAPTQNGSSIDNVYLP